jgi:cell division protein FtsB
MSNMIRKKTGFSYAKEIYYILCFAVVLLITLFTLLGPEGYLKMKEDESELEAQRERVRQLQKQNEERLNRIKSLRSDEKTLEGYARENGYGRKGEIVQELPEPTTPNKP